MYNVDGDISKTILMPKNKSEDGHIWNLGLELFRVRGHSDFHMQASNVILTNEFGTLTIQIPKSPMLNWSLLKIVALCCLIPMMAFVS